jgi:E3 ubiquitin-protein ligase TRIP12
VTNADYYRNQSAPADEASKASPDASSSRRKSQKKDKKKCTTSFIHMTWLTDLDARESRVDSTEALLSPSRLSRTKNKVEEPAVSEGQDTEQTESDMDEDPVESEEDENFEDEEDDDDGDENEAEFERHLAGPAGSRFESAMRSIHGVITRTMSELRVILDNLRRRDDPTAQRTALEELAQVLLMANEDTLAGHFSPDPYIKELIPLMEPSEVWGENPEMMLMACRCLANMMEALPASTANIVYGGAVPILCKKLLEIHYIDVAEQALSVSQVSREFTNCCRLLKRFLQNFLVILYARVASRLV